MVPNPPASVGDVRDTSSILGREDALEEGLVTHFSILAWRVPWTVEPGGLTVHRVTERTQRKQPSTPARGADCSLGQNVLVSQPAGIMRMDKVLERKDVKPEENTEGRTLRDSFEKIERINMAKRDKKLENLKQEGLIGSV